MLLFCFSRLLRSFQISVSIVSDICQYQIRRHNNLEPLCSYIIIAERYVFSWRLHLSLFCNILL